MPTGIVLVILAAGLVWWCQNDRGEASIDPGSSQDMGGVANDDSLSVGDDALEDSTETDDVSHSSNLYLCRSSIIWKSFIYIYIYIYIRSYIILGG